MTIDELEIKLNDGRPAIVINDVGEALRLLTEDWPSERGPRHRDAVDTCLKVMDGHPSSSEVRRVLAEAASEASFSVSAA